METGYDPHFVNSVNPVGEACLVASPFIALAGGIWLLVLLVRRFFT
jgi:hypothetical protein